MCILRWFTIEVYECTSILRWFTIEIYECTCILRWYNVYFEVVYDRGI